MDDDFFVLAVQSLVPNAKFHAACGNPDFNKNRIIDWTDERPRPTDAELKTEFDRQKELYITNQYQRDRKPLYPQLEEQLDALWHAIDSGALDKTSKFYTDLKAVKDKHPKLSE